MGLLLILNMVVLVKARWDHQRSAKSRTHM